MKAFRPLLIAALLFTQHAAYATSFNCHDARSLTEKMICNDPALSKLDDTLGQLYWKARRRVANRRAFLDDSDSKWAWRETNCRDADCLTGWYASRIDELRRLIDSMQAGIAPSRAGAPDSVERRDPNEATHAPTHAPTHEPTHAPTPAPSAIAGATCTAANPGLVVGEQCSTVLHQSIGPWKYKPRDSEWFCGVAMLPPPQLDADADR